MKIEYHPALEDELREIRDYYDGQSFGLGDEFIAAFENQVRAIAATPERWMVAARDVRRALMRRFPYVIHFRIVRDDTLRITVVKHTKRHPGYGQGRT